MELWLAIGAALGFGGLIFAGFQSVRLKAQQQRTADVQKEADEYKIRFLDSVQLLRESGERHQELSLRFARLDSEHNYQKQVHEERVKTLESAEQRLSQSFQVLSADALRQSSDSFMQLAKSVLQQHEVKAQGELELRRQAVDQLVEPIHRSLGKVEERIIDLEKQRIGAYHGLQEQVGLLFEAQKKLQLEAANLVMALRSPSTRGRWGELQLRRVVELAGMLEYCDFEEQSSLGTEQRQRPDMIVRLPGKRSIVIDAKVPLQAYLDAVECADDDKRQEYYRQHALQVKRQVQALGQKAYWDQLPGSPEFVLLFLPGESFFSAALQADPSLIEVGADHRVLIATPTTLIALLRTSAYAWRQEDIARNAQDICRLGKELYQRICDMSAHVADTGRSLGAAVQSYNKMVGTIESRVMVTARRFQDLRADDLKKDLKELPVIEHQPRGLARVEPLLGSEAIELT